jgi:Na+-transporting methylmalonyl-CoA/oxaloacetate decarboxylase gamma subunit
MNIAMLLQHTAGSADSVRALINHNSTEFGIYDSFGIGMTLVGMAVVFFALLLLYILFSAIAKLLSKKFGGEKKPIVETQSAMAVSEGVTGEINAAIAAALFLYNNEMHDHESEILTIQKIQRTYSPWSSKIYSLRKNPRQ